MHSNPNKGPPGNSVLKALTPRDFGKNLSYPSPLDFKPVCIYGFLNEKRSFETRPNFEDWFWWFLPLTKPNLT